MPRKAKLIKKDEGKIIEEKTPLSQEEINSLEQKLEEDDEKVDLSELKEFLNEQKIESISSSPSLKKINFPQRGPVILERDIITGNMAINTANKEEEENGFKYMPNNKGTNEPKYIQYDGTVSVESIIPKREFESFSMKTPFEKKEVRFESSMQSRTPEQTSFEKYSPASKLDKDKNLKRNPFEKTEIKYTPEKY
jgi:hypothetical protein